MEAHHHARMFTSYLFRLTLADLDKILAANREAINQQLNGNLASMISSELETINITRTVFAKALSDHDLAYLNDTIEALRKE